MFDLQQSTRRRGFLGTVAAGVATLGIATLTAPFRGTAKPNLPPDTMNSDAEAWLNKIQGKHRQVFDATSANGGMPLAWTRVYMTTNNATGTQDSDLGAVVILRHAAIPLAMEDRLWTKYKFGEVFKVDDGATKAAALRNPFWNPKAGELPFPDMSVDQLQKRGALFCVCDMAMTFYSMNVGKSMNMDPAEVKKDWISGIFPGIQIVPSGVWAVNRTQEHGCTYCYGG